MPAEQIRLGGEEGANDATHNLAGLVVQLVHRWAEDRLEDRDQVGCQALDGGLADLIKHGDALVNRAVLLKVVLQGQEVNESGQDLGDRNAVRVRHDHAAQATSSVVLDASILDLKHGLELAKDGF